MTFNRDTYCHDLIRLMGGKNVFAERKRRYPLDADLGFAAEIAGEGVDTRYPHVTVEEVLEAQPELILLPDEPYLFQDEDVQEIFRLLEKTPAVKHNKVYGIEGSLLTWHGTRLGKALVELTQYFD